MWRFVLYILNKGGQIVLFVLRLERQNVLFDIYDVGQLWCYVNGDKQNEFIRNKIKIWFITN